VKIGLDGQNLWTGVIGWVVKINYFYITGRVEFRLPNSNSRFNNIPSAEIESAFYTEPEVQQSDQNSQACGLKLNIELSKKI